MNFGYELKPTGRGQKARDVAEAGLRPKPNTKDVENGIEQLEYSYLPKLIDIEREWTRDYNYKRPVGVNFVGRLGAGVRKDHAWCLLVTNAKLMLFKPPKAFGDLEHESALKDDGLFIEAPWLVFHHPPSLRLLDHQSRHLNDLPLDTPERELSLPALMSNHSPQIHVINFDQLARFVGLLNDPPRLKQIVIKLFGDGVESKPLKVS